MDFKFFGWVKPNFNSTNAMLINNDCRNILNTVPCESIDLFCSDIPYKISHSGAGIKKDGKKYMGGMLNSYDDSNENKENIKKGKIFEHNDIKISEYIEEVYRVLKERNSLLLV